jgi:serine/threonine-protein kinase
MRISPLLSAILLAVGGMITFVSDARPDDDVADRAFKILKERCYACHGVEFYKPNLDVMDRKTLVADRNGKPRFVEPGNPEKSLIWIAVNRSEADLLRMPQNGSLSPAEKNTLREWIVDGAPFPEAKVDVRPFVTDLDVLKEIRNHLLDVDESDAEFMRYFTLTHLHNNLSVLDTELRLYRAALSKTVNALSRKGAIVVPEQVDKWGTIYAVDLRKYGWEADNFTAWKQVVQAYPYGLKLLDRTPRNQFNQIQQRINDAVVSIRADWFVAKATRPPLYHSLAGIPETLDELISKNKRQGDFKSNLLIRGGVQQSGVSTQNRLIDFFPAGPNTRETWISYDFQRSVARSNIFRFPLGPESLVEKKVPEICLSACRQRDHLPPSQRLTRLYARQQRRKANRHRAGIGRA